MNNFTYHNPVRVVFGKGSIAELGHIAPHRGKLMLCYGGGSIYHNGVYEQVKGALGNRAIVEFGGIEPNPRYETLLRATELARSESVDFLLAVGGGSVLDGVKFIAAAIPFAGDPWEFLQGKAPKKALPIGAVLTLPATGSEMNCFAVISRDATGEKRAFGHPLLYPVFSILDPETTFSLPPHQIANGIVDAWVHVCEQYLTPPADTPLQDRLAEAILCTLREEGPKTLAQPTNYEARANLMWCATAALNGFISVGVSQDWATHALGHQLTARYGLDHAQTLAIVLPGILAFQSVAKLAKLAQYGNRVWDVEGSPETCAQTAIGQTEMFFNSLGVKTRLAGYGLTPTPAELEIIAARATAEGPLGENQAIDKAAARQILESRR